MKNKILLILGLLSFSTFVYAQDSKPFVVVESFTSEGCSSCPPAYEVLKEIKKSAQINKQEIFILDFHVDYWDQLGWKDPWSSPQFTKRQYQYAQNLKNSSVYTPEMIINGQYAFVGSNDEKAMKYINLALAEIPQASIGLEFIDETLDHFEIAYKISPTPTNAILNIAFVEDGLVSDVLKGENEGQTFTHTATVLSFKKILPTGEGQIKILKPANFKPSNSMVIVYLQDPTDMRILAAHSLNLNE